MGTRGFVGFVVDGREAIAYNHAASHPEDAGLNTLAWLDHANLHIAAKVAKGVRIVTGNTPPTDDDIECLMPYLRQDTNTSERPSWYQLLHGTMGRVGEMIACGVVLDASRFPRIEGEHCRWGYLVDFDTWRFEVYCGMQKNPHADGRFAGAGRNDTGYWPSRLVASWPLDDRPDEDAFLAALNEDEEDKG